MWRAWNPSLAGARDTHRSTEFLALISTLDVRVPPARSSRKTIAVGAEVEWKAGRARDPARRL